MTIIEAMKRIKANKVKLADLQQKIALYSAHTSLEAESTPYGHNTAAKVAEWTNTCEDLSQENMKLDIRIQKTNLATPVTIALGGREITKCIAEWVLRRRKYANDDFQTWSRQTDRGLKVGMTQGSQGAPVEVKLIRNYDTDLRDKKMVMYQMEPHEINAKLEVVNATTELLEW
jgi:hypothetical protein